MARQELIRGCDNSYLPVMCRFSMVIPCNFSGRWLDELVRHIDETMRAQGELSEVIPVQRFWVKRQARFLSLAIAILENITCYEFRGEHKSIS